MDPENLPTGKTGSPGRTWERLALYLSIYAVTVVLTSLLWQRPATLTLAFALESMLLIWRWHSRSELTFFVLAAVLGPMGEFVAVGFGAWHYALPWVQIPIWLPLAYGIVGLFLSKTVGLLLAIKPRWAPATSVEPAHLAELRSSFQRSLRVQADSADSES